MGLKNLPHKTEFSGFLKRMVNKGAEVGYSRQPLSQKQALGLRQMEEPNVEVVNCMLVDPLLPSYFRFSPDSKFGRRDAGEG